MELSYFKMPRQPLSDENVTLNLLTKNDFEELYKVASDPLIWEQHPTNNRWKKEVFQSYFNAAIASETAFLIREKQNNKVIGCSRYYDYKSDSKNIAIGYTFLGREFWGGVYNKSVKQLMLNYAFQFVDSVFFHVGATNFRSQKAVIKMGCVLTKFMDTDLNGNPIAHLEYEIKKADWVNKNS